LFGAGEELIGRDLPGFVLRARPAVPAFSAGFISGDM
jgi:hypothetical protein